MTSFHYYKRKYKTIRLTSSRYYNWYYVYMFFVKLWY